VTVANCIQIGKYVSIKLYLQLKEPIGNDRKEICKLSEISSPKIYIRDICMTGENIFSPGNIGYCALDNTNNAIYCWANNSIDKCMILNMWYISI
jgi:hypothetical protein